MPEPHNRDNRVTKNSRGLIFHTTSNRHSCCDRLGLVETRADAIVVLIKAAQTVSAAWPKNIRPRGSSGFTDTIADLDDALAALAAGTTPDA